MTAIKFVMTSVATMFHLVPTRPLIQRASEGLRLSFGTFFLTILLELWSRDTVKRVKYQKGGSSLYAKAIRLNLQNHFVFGWTLYTVASLNFCRVGEDLDTFERMYCVFSILLTHSICFYSAHRVFHTYPSMYKHHKFHHRFNVHVPPMAANAVSSVEYLVAYIIPFILPMPVLKPDPFSLQLSVAIVSVTNVLVHTPKLSELSERYLPECFVSTSDHLEHHRKLNTKYAAPTINVDYFIKILEDKPHSRMSKTLSQ